jgi:hypothetical protein
MEANMSEVWTKEAVAVLQKMSGDGFSHDRIAVELYQLGLRRTIDKGPVKDKIYGLKKRNKVRQKNPSGKWRVAATTILESDGTKREFTWDKDAVTTTTVVAITEPDKELVDELANKSIPKFLHEPIKWGKSGFRVDTPKELKGLNFIGLTPKFKNSSGCMFSVSDDVYLEVQHYLTQIAMRCDVGNEQGLEPTVGYDP